METHYSPQDIESAAQQFWQAQASFTVTEDPNKEKFYCLSMLPYPSGQLHMGHVRNYTIGDVISRYQRMLGKNVLQPMGWDAFGLPAENAAIKHNVPPARWTYQNIEDMRRQFNALGLAYDWSRELATCTPDYYRWEQWLFIQLYKEGLVYKKNAMVNWDPVDNTVLANEQVVDGRGWRSGALIERREIPQWFIKITAYADELLSGLETLDGWPEQVKTMQNHWVGRSEGVEIQFSLSSDEAVKIPIYTTRPDTLFGATYMAIAPQHPLAIQAAASKPALRDFLETCQHTQVAEAAIATMEKRGMDTGLQAIHPLTQQPIPIWVANFVLMEYGAGAVMSVPAHDERDFEFAQKYQLPITHVVQPSDGSTWDFSKAALVEKGTVVNSGEFDGLTSAQAFNAIADALVAKQQGERKTHFRLRDWGVSRQRYWGTPIPMIHCDSCGTVPVPETDLPVKLPEDVALDGSQSPLTQMPEFYQVACPSCGKPAKRETDTFDTFVESSWYYLRYACPGLTDKMLDERANYWGPVDQYIGGVEHAVMHLLYARFYHKLLRDQGLVSSDEPFTRLLTQGMVLKDGAKMSKSKGNVVEPTALIKRFGADTVRLFSAFAAPPEQSLEWSDSGVEGAYRFLKRLWGYAVEQQTLCHTSVAQKQPDAKALSKAGQSLRLEIHSHLNQARHDMERLQLNTVVSAAMKMLNALTKFEPENAEDNTVICESLSILVRLLSPITPHIAHQLWQDLQFGDSVIDATWPEVDESALKTDSISLVVQVNGKLRSHVDVPADADKSHIETIALADENVKKFVGQGSVKKIIVVPKRLVNIVVAPA